MKFENRKQRNALLDIAGTLHIKLLSLFWGGGTTAPYSSSSKLLFNRGHTSETWEFLTKITSLYSFFWVIPRRLNFRRRRFGTSACSIFIGCFNDL